MNDFVVIGLTGPSGAGKSTVARELERQGCRVVDCDRIAREITDTCQPCLKELAAEFGGDILQEGKLDRKLLARRAFSSREREKRLNAIIHPWILAQADREIESYRKDGIRFVILDAPLLIEAGADRKCGFILAVTAPEEIRAERVMRRDGISLEETKRRFSVQHEESFYTERANAVIDGSRSLEEIAENIARILKKLRDNG